MGSLDPGKAQLGPSVGKPSNTLVSQRIESDYSWKLQWKQTAKV